MGFTLAETLLAVVILLLASTVVATGMPAALSAYRNAIDAANAQVVLSATVNALRSELTTARDVNVQADTNAITYYDAETGSRCRIYIDTDPADGYEKIFLQTYDDLNEDTSLGITVQKPDPRLLISDAMTKTTKDRTDNMTVTYTGASLSDGVVTITGLSVKREGSELARMESDLTIRPLSPAPEEP